MTQPEQMHEDYDLLHTNPQAHSICCTRCDGTGCDIDNNNLNTPCDKCGGNGLINFE